MRYRLWNGEGGMRISWCLILLAGLAFATFAQVPEPGPAKSVNIPPVKETRLKNGLTVAVVEKHGVPIVTVQMLIKAGASSETIQKSGLANMTASILTKGTKTRSAEQIAQEVEFLGGSISSSAGWNNSSVSITVTSDKLQQAMTILADVVLNPAFKQEELDLLKSQTLDDLKYNLKQPGPMANYVASRRVFNEHPAGGTPESIESFTRDDVVGFYSRVYGPDRSVLIFAGDITPTAATAASEKLFGMWPQQRPGPGYATGRGVDQGGPLSIVRRILVVDLPDSGQAAVNFYKPVLGVTRGSKDYYSASVLNSLLGGGYSSRLNQEIRIKRGLSYGALSSFAWRSGSANFGARTQTKNESAAEVAELVIAELKRLAETDAAEAELNPRRLVLTGGFGRTLETTAGLTAALGDLYSFGVPPNELNSYMPSVGGVSSAAVKSFAAKNLVNGEIIIVGDYSAFKDDLAKRFPTTQIDVVKAAELNIESPTLRKSDVQ